MKLIIFAGGIGTRLWPLSRENSPKQFDKIFNGKSTLQLAVDRVAPAFGVNNIFVQTVAQYKQAVMGQLPELPEENILIEPARRNLGPAVCFSAVELEKRGLGGPMALLWADHLMDKPEAFTAALKASEALIEADPKRFIFLGEQPRFANNNLGWITVGDRLGGAGDSQYYEFKGWKYKPEPDECKRLFESGQAYWNPGYFITSIEFLLDRYKTIAADIYEAVSTGNYEQAEAIHFDRAIAERIDKNQAVVIKTDLGWSDPGTLYALKEALASNLDENVIQGEVTGLDCKDCLLYNFEKDKIVAGIGLEGMVIVNTNDALVIVPKEEVVKITDLVKKMRDEGKGKYL